MSKVEGFRVRNYRVLHDVTLGKLWNTQKDPFYAQQMSDGTLKVFAYLLLLEDPSPPPFLCMRRRARKWTLS
ncbi:MAG: AAA family ATPase [Nostoc sp.]|uniref:AAA family ATPase n=1 Tax=Nostoc sp. TaxID=1180 RepID=UPI002FF98E1A